MIKKLKTLLALGVVTVVTAGTAAPANALSNTKTSTTKRVIYVCINGKKYQINTNCSNNNNNGSTSKPDNNTGSNGSTSKPDSDTDSNNGSTSKPDNNTGSNNDSTSKPDNNAGSNNDSTSKPDNNTGSNNDSTSKPDNNTDSNNGSTNQDSTNSFAAYQQEVVNLVNKERAKYGLSALKSNASLANVATIKSQDMIDKNYFDHTSPTYGSPFDMMKQFGISYKTAGENIAMGQKTPTEVVNAWMNSPGHRANILNENFTQIGVGVAKNSKGQLYWTQMFIG